MVYKSSLNRQIYLNLNQYNSVNVLLFWIKFLLVCDLFFYYIKNDLFQFDRENMKINKYIMKNNLCVKMEKFDYIYLLIFSIFFWYVFFEFLVYFFLKDFVVCVLKQFDVRRNIKG